LIGSRLIGDTFRQGALTGMALMPQAGVAIGMSHVAAELFPQYGEANLATAIASTIVFEVFGPLLTQHALRKASDSEPSRALAQDRDP
jgi:hypothetical protein